MADQLDFDRALGLCFSRVRFLSALLKDRLREEKVWEDLRQEMHLAAWEAVELGLSEQETRRLAGQHLYAFLKANGWRRRNGHWKMERPLSLNRTIGDTEDIELQDTVAAPEEDWDAALDARARLENCPPGIKRIARKLDRGDPLTLGEKACLLRFREDGRPNPKLAWQWRRYWERRSLGLCVTCGERAEDGFARCAACRERFRAMESRWKRGKGRAWQAKLKEHWRKEGRCWRCGRPPKQGRKKCPQCLAKDREGLRRWKERQKARDELRKALQGYDRNTIIAVLERALKEFRNETDHGGQDQACGLAPAGR